MQITLYSFSKKVNSTKTPSGGVSVNVLLKEPTDILAPTVRLSRQLHGEYNYFKLFDNFYWITAEVVTPNNWTEISGRIDAMGTCASDIKDTVAYVVRSQQGNTLIDDNTMPNTMLSSLVQKTEINVGEFEDTGCYLLSVLGGVTSSSQAGIACTYALSSITMRRVSEILTSTDFLDQIIQYFYDPYGAIISCIWIPLLPEDVATSFGQLIIGNYETGINVPVVNKQTIKYIGGTTLNIDKTKYTYTNRFCTMTLYLPFVGDVNLNINAFLFNPVISIETTIDVYTGAITYLITDGYNIIATYGGSCGVTMPVGKTGYNPTGILTGAIDAGLNLATGNVISALGNTIGIIGNSSQTNQISGAFGSRAGMVRFKAELVIKQWGTSEGLNDRASVIGLPYCKTAKLGSMSGYVQCQNASIASNKPLMAIEECNSYLNNGAFIE